jgi:hypothetical protein
VFDITVGEHQHGRAVPEVRHLHRHLPWVSLIIADLLLSIVRGGLGLLGVIPAAVFVTLTCITGPVIMIERRGAFQGIARSTRLLWPNFWLAFVAVTIPFVLEIGLVLLVEAAHPPLAAHLFILVVIETPVLAFVALSEVTLAYRLVHRAWAVEDASRIASAT